jgi:hypothetical protein
MDCFFYASAMSVEAAACRNDPRQLPERFWAFRWQGLVSIGVSEGGIVEA